MPESTDELVGRAKEAAGALAENDELKQEGQDQQRAGKVKDAIDDAGDALKRGVDRVKDALHRDRD